MAIKKELQIFEQLLEEFEKSLNQKELINEVDSNVDPNYIQKLRNTMQRNAAGQGPQPFAHAPTVAVPTPTNNNGQTTQQDNNTGFAKKFQTMNQKIVEEAQALNDQSSLVHQLFAHKAIVGNMLGIYKLLVENSQTASPKLKQHFDEILKALEVLNTKMQTPKSPSKPTTQPAANSPVEKLNQYASYAR